MDCNDLCGKTTHTTDCYDQQISDLRAQLAERDNTIKRWETRAASLREHSAEVETLLVAAQKRVGQLEIIIRIMELSCGMRILVPSTISA